MKKDFKWGHLTIILAAEYWLASEVFVSEQQSIDYNDMAALEHRQPVRMK